MSKINLRSSVAFLTTVGLLGLAACSTDNPFGLLQTSVTVTGNLTAAPLSATASSPDSKASATVQIPQDTMLFDANGNLLSNSSVSMTIDAFDGSAAAESQFEGGTQFTDQQVISQVANALGKNIDASRPATIDVAGYAVITVLAGGTEVKQFGQAITVVVGTPGLTPGTTVAIITVDEDTGERRFETSTTVRSNRTVIFNLDHLTTAAAIGNVTGTLSGGGGG